ncbi:MAG: Type 1 glutamine amidotransferase-like domain-containing protein [Oscillospiraceae bacterium]|nr:Type 1 glutamine amidotransferase-like domain-containing protein [Oscillospiraceae bacterium]
MIFLTSNGLTSEELQNEFLSAIRNTNMKCAVIPTAMEKEKDKDIWLEKTIAELKKYGLTCEFFYFGIDNNDKLNEYDILYICGGNVFYLLSTIKQCCVENHLKTAANERIIVGVSAGSLIMQANLELIRDLIPRMNKRVKLKDFTGLNLTNGIEHLPHRTRYIESIDSFEKRVKTYQRKTGIPVICLEDGQGIIINDNDIKEIF